MTNTTNQQIIRIKQGNKLFFVHFALIGLFVYLFIGLFTSTVGAQQATQRTITVVPPTVQVNLDPGAKTEGVMKVINDSDEPITFSVAMRDYIVVDKYGTPNILPPNTLNDKYSGASWIGVIPTTITVQPHQRQELRYYIQVPADARPGGHYAAAVYIPVDNSSVEGSGSVVETQIGTLFYVGVHGDITEKASITQFIANAFQEYGPVKLTTDINNQGDLHIKPAGSITITDIFGRTIQKQALSEYNIFPGSSRIYENTVGQKWMVGPFKANLVAGYGKDNNLPIIASVTFWVFPWKVALIIVLAIIAIVLAVIYWKKRNQNTSVTHHNDHTATETV